MNGGILYFLSFQDSSVHQAFAQRLFAFSVREAVCLHLVPLAK